MQIFSFVTLLLSFFLVSLVGCKTTSQNSSAVKAQGEVVGQSAEGWPLMQYDGEITNLPSGPMTGNGDTAFTLLVDGVSLPVAVIGTPAAAGYQSTNYTFELKVNQSVRVVGYRNLNAAGIIATAITQIGAPVGVAKNGAVVGQSPEGWPLMQYDGKITKLSSGAMTGNGDTAFTLLVDGVSLPVAVIGTPAAAGYQSTNYTFELKVNQSVRVVGYRNLKAAGIIATEIKPN